MTLRESRRSELPIIGLFHSGLYVAKLSKTAAPSLTTILMVLTLVSGATPAAVAWVGKLILDGVIEAKSSASPTPYLFIVIEAGMTGLWMLSMRASGTVRTLLGLRLSEWVRDSILRQTTKLTLAELEVPKVHDQITRLRKEASNRPVALLQRSFELVRHATSLLSYGALIIAFSGWLAVLLVIASLPTLFTEVGFAKRQFQLSLLRSKANRERNYIENVLSREDFAKEVRLYNLGDTLVSRFQRITDGLLTDERKLLQKKELTYTAASVVSTGAFFTAYVWIVSETITGSLSIGEMTIMLIAFRQSQTSVSNSAANLGTMYGDHLYVADLRSFLESVKLETHLDSTRFAATPEQQASRAPERSGIRLEGVRFRYPGSSTYALDGIDLSIPPGALVGVVGRNGSGKSTLVKLIAGFYQPTEGTIWVDDKRLDSIDRQNFLSRLAILFQDHARFKFTVADNIGFGNTSRLQDENEIWLAAKKAYASDFIERLPRKLSTRLGRSFEGGMDLSGGQWQKLALARALIRTEADYLILDEPTAALDALSEQQLLTQLQSQRNPTEKDTHSGQHAQLRNRSVLLISHRLATLQHADVVLVLDKGRLVEQGTHDQLIVRDGLYSKLFEAQASAYTGFDGHRSTFPPGLQTTRSASQTTEGT